MPDQPTPPSVREILEQIKDAAWVRNSNLEEAIDRAEAQINQLRTAELETLRNEKREIIFGDGIRREAIPMTALDALIERVKNG